ncbi:MAG: hypothetical protein GF418_15300 [Chitinivibrionales bacterium]|nr:hypothetical protein [Chitinivibrionales bacterium]MBD3396988.1 hypothetical protein [Chitinivibrionales bacterium]
MTLETKRITYLFTEPGPLKTTAMQSRHAGRAVTAAIAVSLAALSCLPTDPEDKNEVPQASGDAYSIRGDSTLTVGAASGVLANDTDADGHALTAVLAGDASLGTLSLNADGSFSYTPDGPAYASADTFTYTARDSKSGESPAATVVIAITPVVADMICPHAPDGDVSNDPYRIVSPNGGEVYRIGDTITVHIHVNTNMNTNMTIVFGPDGLYKFTPPGIGGFDAYEDSIQTFVVPEYFEQQVWNPDIGDFEMEQISPVSDSCLMRVADYEDLVRDYSDCYFAIRE